MQVEIGRQDDGLKKWTTDRPHMFVPLDTEIQQAARDVLAAFPLLVKAFSTRNQADPFVIATAKVRGLTLVTDERSGRRAGPGSRTSARAWASSASA